MAPWAKYLRLVYQINEGCVRLLWIGKERSTKTLLRFFRFLGKERSLLVARINKAIDEVRAEEHRQMKKDGHEEVLTKSRWCLLKRKKNLTQKQEVKLNEILKYNLRSVRAYLLKEEFNGLWEYVSPSWAGKFIDRWCPRVIRSRIVPLKKEAKTIRKHNALILNWFKAKKAFFCGIVEGLNNKVKLTIRKSYGFKTFNCTEIALYHVPGKLPEPKLHHKFY